MTTFEFAGTISAQAQAGETVTITITKPDTTTEILTTQTLADMTYAVSKTYVEAGDYKAKAHGDKVETSNIEYSAWDSVEVPFTVKSAIERTGTLVVRIV